MNTNLSRSSAASVRNYYERNTRRFMRFGGSANAGAIHRKLWGEGVETQHEALLHTNQLVAQWLTLDQARGENPTRILDLGCGVGGTAIWLASHYAVDVTGITISPRQVNEARKRASTVNLRGQCAFLEANFDNMTLGGAWQAAYAIEAFTHATSAEQFFVNTAKHLEPEGRIFLIDDFLSDHVEDGGSESHNRDMWIQRFKHGWHLSNLATTRSAEDTARRTGFRTIRSINLTPMIRLPGKVRSLALRIISGLPGSGTYWASLKGGIALQVCLQRGWVEYRMLELQRGSRTPGS